MTPEAVSPPTDLGTPNVRAVLSALDQRLPGDRAYLPLSLYHLTASHKALVFSGFLKQGAD